MGACPRNRTPQVSAQLEPVNEKKVKVQFKEFKILGVIPVKAPETARGELTITYLDDDLRVSRGDKGNLFVLSMYLKKLCRTHSPQFIRLVDAYNILCKLQTKCLFPCRKSVRISLIITDPGTLEVLSGYSKGLSSCKREATSALAVDDGACVGQGYVCGSIRSPEPHPNALPDE
eukprot:364496-Chlamydomonas_euryale.AAC.24